MPTILDLGKLVKAKYPGQYDQLSDAEVGQKVKAKYPGQYSSFTDVQQASEGRNILQKTAGFLGIEKFGQGIASAGRVLTGQADQSGNEAAQSLTDYVKERSARQATGQPLNTDQKARLQQVASGKDLGYTPQSEIDPGTTLSNREVIGSAANVALNVAAPSSFSGGFKAIVAKNAAVGAGFGLAGGLNDKEDVAGIIKSAFTGAAIGGAIPIAGKLAGKALAPIKKGLTERLPESLMNHAVKPTLNELKKNLKTGSPTLGKELLAEGVAGSPKQLLKVADSRLTSYEDKLQKTLASSDGVVSRERLRPYFQSTIEKLQMTPGSKDAALKVEELLADVPESMTLSQANVVKRNLYERLRDVAYKLDPSLSDKKEAMKTLARGLKTEIEINSDNPQLIQSLNKRLSIYGRLEDRVVDIIARNDRNALIGLRDTILLGASAINPIALIGLLGEKASTSTKVLTNAAKGLNKLKNVGTGKPTKVIKNIVKRAVLNSQ